MLTCRDTLQVRAFERRCAHLYGHKAESRGLLPERKVGLQSSPFGLCDREEVRQGIARLRDALLRHATTVEGEGGQSGILLYDFQAACHELGQDMGDEGFGILSGDLALIAAVHSSVTFMLQRRRRVQIMVSTESQNKCLATRTSREISPHKLLRWKENRFSLLWTNLCLQYT
jgi:hypothetical protein